MTKKTRKNPIDESIPLIEHLAELRKRIIYSILAIVFCSIAVYPFNNYAINHLTQYVGKLVFISPVEAFWSRIKLTFFLGIFLSAPFVFFQIWKFVEKGLLLKEKSSLLMLSFSSYILFSLGAGFGYFVIIPVGVKFLLAYGSQTLVPMISVSKYISFLFALVFSFGLIFEMPLILGFLAKAGILEAKTLSQNRRLAIVGIFIAAAALTPGPDIFSQLLMAGPLLVLYEISIIVARLIERGR